ncbi:protoporphyrinogen oxidase [Amycolatopsis pigmentata]|uniref:Coproporphyrinogen III oxidase n=1 Tax=Amycolatopsis pigmentata TaxID=450801 RepID=A0ABW5FXN0_9PSEU
MRVAVVGGGVSGLTAAYRLRTRLGDTATITVLEADGVLGGKLRTAEVAGVRFDVGAEAFLSRRPEALELIRETGLADEVVHPTPARSTVCAGGRRVPLPGGTMMGVPGSADAVAGVLSERGREMVAAEPGLPPVSLGEEDVALGGLLRSRFGDELVDRLVDPLLGGVYAGGADGLGLRATLPALASAIEGGAGSLTVAAASLLPAPAKGSPGTPVFGTLTGGLGTLVDRLAELAKPDLRLETRVVALRRRETGWTLETGHGETLDADAVILAVPAPAARRLLDGVVPEASEALSRIELASMAVVALALPPGTELPDASGVLISAGERHRDGTPFAAKAFTFSSRKWAHFAGGPVFVRGSVGRFREPGALRADDTELVRLVRADLAELTGITAAPVDVVVTRWGGGLPQYGVGHLGLVERAERAVSGLPGLAIAGAALHGVGVPACIGTATAAAEAIVAGIAP